MWLLLLSSFLLTTIQVGGQNSTNLTNIVVKKCCPDGFGVDNYSAHGCSPMDAEFSPESVIDPLSTYEIASNSSIQCSYYDLFLPETYADHEFHVQAGGLVFRHQGFTSPKQTDNYCVDLTEGGPSGTQVR